MTRYYEAHVTMMGDPEAIRPRVEALKWKFSMIDGDANLGDGIKCYATRQMNIKVGDELALEALHQVADLLSPVAEILRRKIEVVIYDDRSSLVRPCEGNCVECVG